MIRSLYVEKDTTIYELSKSLNTGVDEFVQLNKASSSAGIYTSRILTQFDFSAISKSVVSGDIVNPKYYLNLYIAEADELMDKYNLVAYAVSQSWEMGTGKLQEPVANRFSGRGTNNQTRGASWTYRNKIYDEQNSSGDIKWTSASYDLTGTDLAPSTSRVLYNNVSGGGSWWHEYYGTQSFDYESADVRMNVTPIVNRWIGTGSNYPNELPVANEGFILLRSGSEETNAIQYGNLNFFSRETNTIYQPRIEVVYDDTKFETGTLSALGTTDNIIHLKNLKNEYSVRETPKIRVAARERYPTRTFQTSSNYKTTKYLPSHSYYSVTDALTEDIIVPYDPTGSKLSCDSDGSFFNLRMDTFLPKRYYKLRFHVTQSDGTYVEYDDGYYFKVNR